MTPARRCRWDRGALAPAVHRFKLRRGAAGGHGGVSHRAKASLTAARRKVVVFVSDAGEAGAPVASGFVSSLVLYVFCSSVYFVYVVVLVNI